MSEKQSAQDYADAAVNAQKHTMMVNDVIGHISRSSSKLGSVASMKNKSSKGNMQTAMTQPAHAHPNFNYEESK